MKTLRFAAVCIIGLFAWQCNDMGEIAPERKTISSDADLSSLVLHEQPYATYPLFPGVDSVAAGTLNGSNAHTPLVRVSMNEKAFSALSGGALPTGTSFPEGSVIVKEIREDGHTTLVAVMYRDAQNPLSGSGWLWAEYTPDGTAMVSVQSRGSGCVGCHSREQGLQHDLVRTFERQTR
jgi:hypothetical protein